MVKVPRSRQREHFFDIARMMESGAYFCDILESEA